MKRLLPLALFLVLAPAPAQEHQRIEAERARVEARYAETERECAARFVVAACLDEAQVTRRDALTKLRKQELALDQAERKQKAAERTAAIREKENAPPPSAQPLPMPSRAASAEPAADRQAPPNARVRQPKPVPPQPSAEELAANRARYEKRQLDAQKHREEVTRRNQEQAAKKKPARPLPAPPAGSAP